MGTLHVCFADLPHYGKITPSIAAPSSTATTNPTEILCELSDAVDVTAADSPSIITEQADSNKGMPPCSLSPGANSAQSTSPTPRYERNISFFHQLSRRFGLLRSSDDPVFSAAEDDSTDSCSSTTGALPPMQRSTVATTTSSLCTPNGGDIASLSSNNNIGGKNGAHLHTGNGACLKDSRGSSSEHISCASSETSSTTDIEESQEQQMCSPKAAAAATVTKLSPTKERRSSARASFSRLHRRSTSSIRRAFESLSLSTRSLSCSGATPTAVNTANNAQHAAQRSDSSNTPIKSALKYNSNVELNRKSQAGGGGGRGGVGAWHTSYSASSLQLTSSTTGTSSSSTSKSSSKAKTKPPPQRILRQPVSYTYLKGISGLPTQRVPRSAVCCQYARR